MAEVTYDLEYFAATAKKKKPPAKNLKVAKRERSARSRQVARMVRTMFMVLLVVVLVFAVLHTQARLTDISIDISTLQANLNDEQSIYTYLNFELESKTNLRNIEERARELGLAKVDKTQVEYVRVEGEEGITVRQKGFGSLLAGLNTSFSAVKEKLAP